MPDIRFHHLRHSRPSLLLPRDGHTRVMAVMAVMEILGRGTITLTMNTL